MTPAQPDSARLWVIAVRVDPDEIEPKLFTLWYQDEPLCHGSFLVWNQRLVWSTTPEGAVELAPPDYRVVPDDPYLLDLVPLLFDESDTHHEGTLLTAIDQLDDLLITVAWLGWEHASIRATTIRKQLDPVAIALFEGVPASDALELVPDGTTLASIAAEAVGWIVACSRVAPSPDLPASNRS